jgi:uncharacterized OB-fold protein
MTTDAPASDAADPTTTFFAAARTGTLLIQRCEHCGAHQFTLSGLTPGVERCRACAAPRPPWVPAAGTGEVASFTVVHGRSGDDGAPPPRHAAGLVQLDEGPWVQARIDADPDTVHIGMRVAVAFPTADESEEPPPVFVPVGATGSATQEPS